MEIMWIFATVGICLLVGHLFLVAAVFQASTSRQAAQPFNGAIATFGVLIALTVLAFQMLGPQGSEDRIIFAAPAIFGAVLMLAAVFRKQRLRQ
jgi:uncharacterized membrane protein